MRDTYYDCPDRERAQWWGTKSTNSNGFYALSRSSDLLARKESELAAEKTDGTLTPRPLRQLLQGLPMQILVSVGMGFHDYYWYSGDSSFVSQVYGPVRKYLLETWRLDADGMPIYRIRVGTG